jgi:hypothetical protein
MRTVPTAGNGHCRPVSQQPGPGLGPVVSSRYPQYRRGSQPAAAPRVCCRRTALEQPLLGTTTSRLTAHRTSRSYRVPATKAQSHYYRPLIELLCHRVIESIAAPSKRRAARSFISCFRPSVLCPYRTGSLAGSNFDFQRPMAGHWPRRTRRAAGLRGAAALLHS